GRGNHLLGNGKGNWYVATPSFRAQSWNEPCSVATNTGFSPLGRRWRNQPSVATSVLVRLPLVLRYRTPNGITSVVHSDSTSIAMSGIIGLNLNKTESISARPLGGGLGVRALRRPVDSVAGPRDDG